MPKPEVPLKKRLVQKSASQLRALILECEPDTHIGSLSDVAKRFNVGIVTIQQAARILEHEGLLTVKRGPGGGYYASRPDEADFERAFSMFMQLPGSDYREAIELMLLLDCEILPIVAAKHNESQRQQLSELYERLESCNSSEQQIIFEKDFRYWIFAIVNRPLIETVAKITLQFITQSGLGLNVDNTNFQNWKTSRRRMLTAIMERDEEKVEFEAFRYRKLVRTQLLSTQSEHI